MFEYNLIQLTHCASVQFKSEGHVVVHCQRQDAYLLHVFSFKVVSHDCIRVVVPLKTLKIQSMTCNSYELNLSLIDTAPEKFKHAALFLRFSIPSTLISHENRAFRKHSLKRKNLKTPALRFSVDGTHFKNAKSFWSCLLR